MKNKKLYLIIALTIILCVVLVVSLIYLNRDQSVDTKKDDPISDSDDKKDTQEDDTSDDSDIDNNDEDDTNTPVVDHNDGDTTISTPTTATKFQLALPQSVQETSYYCVPACVQMVFRYKGIEMSQSQLASEMITHPLTGTEYVDLARVANKYLFNNENVGPNDAGYHVQTITRYDSNPQIQSDFERRVKQDISTDDPIFVAIDVHELYPNLGHGNHMIVITGYTLVEGSDVIDYYYFIDPSYVVQDDTYGGLKTATREEMIRAIVNNVEPAYIY